MKSTFYKFTLNLRVCPKQSIVPTILNPHCKTNKNKNVKRRLTTKNQNNKKLINLLI